MKKTKILAMILAASLAATSLAACGQSSQTSTATADTEASTAAASSDEAADTETAVSGDVTLPLCDEKTTLTVWTITDSNLQNLVDSLGDTDFFQKLEEKTNVHLEFRTPAVGNEATDFNLMIASGELCDIIKTNTSYNYPGGYDAAVDDGYFLDLTDMMEEYAPHYLAALEAYSEYQPGYEDTAKTAAGRYVYIAQVMEEPEGPWAGLYIRKDWLDDLGLDVPVTYDDWENVLLAFKNEKGATTPLLLSPYGYDMTFNSLNAGYDVSYSFYQVDGEVKFGPAEEGWKEYLTMMNRWYEEGLIDPDFVSSSFWPDTSLITTGKAGAFISMYTLINSYETANTDPDAEYIAVAPPVQNEGDTCKLGTITEASFGCVISADSENAELALRLLDYFFTDEGADFCNYGTEGESFEYDENGDPQYTALVTDNENMTFAEAMAYYCMPAARSVYQAWDRELSIVPEKDQESFEIFSSNVTQDYSLPTSYTSKMSTEQGAEYGTYMADVNTIVSSMTVQFITGISDIDTEWDSYVEQLKAVGLDDAIAIVQDVYDDMK